MKTSTTIIAIVAIIAAMGIGTVATMLPIQPVHANGAEHINEQFGPCTVKGVITPSDRLNVHEHCSGF